MAQDLKKLFEKDREKKYRMTSGHEERFLERLEKKIPQQKKKYSFSWVSVAASVVLLLGVGVFYMLNSSTDDPLRNTVVEKNSTIPVKTGISLGDLSPDLEKIENYYVSNINYELSLLSISDDNKDMVDGFMERLAELDEEYKTLNTELNELGPNDETISALIQNLQLRLQLLQKLKEKLNEFKSSENEQEINIM